MSMWKKNSETNFNVTNSDLSRSIKILDSEANEISLLVSAYRRLKTKLYKLQLANTKSVRGVLRKCPFREI